MNNKYSIIVGRWTGIFSLIWYSDVLNQSDERPYMSFSAFTRRGALKKATRFIRRQLHPLESSTSEIYTYDENTLKLEKIII